MNLAVALPLSFRLIGQWRYLLASMKSKRLTNIKLIRIVQIKTCRFNGNEIATCNYCSCWFKHWNWMIHLGPIPYFGNATLCFKTASAAAQAQPKYPIWQLSVFLTTEYVAETTASFHLRGYVSTCPGKLPQSPDGNKKKQTK